MATAGLGLSAFDVAVKCISLLAYIVKTAENVHKLPAECDEIKSIAAGLEVTLKKYKDTLQDVVSLKRLSKVLENVCIFAAECKHDTVVNKAWEEVWRKKLPSMRQEMLLWILMLNTESTIAIRSDVHLLRSSVEQVQKQEITQASQVMARLSILDELKETLRATNHPVLKVNFEEQDSSLTVRREDVNLLVGALKLGDATASRQIAVNCEPVNEDIMQYGGKGAHHVAIYSRLSANILVHQFYGIAKKFDRRWAVMQDLRDVQTLSAAITSKSLPEAVIGRLNIAYDIAKTIAYLHSVDIVVKRLSDQNIRLVQKENVYTPYLTHLERARLIFEQTTGGAYDVRYEAPELGLMQVPQRSTRTDVYSHPWGQAEEITSGEVVTSIRTQASKQNFTCADDLKHDPLIARIVSLVQRCCHKRPQLRPSAADVVHQILDILVFSSPHERISPPVDEDRRKRILERLDDKNVVAIASEDLEFVRELVDSGDSTAAYYLGLSIWKGLAPAAEDAAPLLTLSATENAKGVRLRSALPHIEFAFNAGNLHAAKTLAALHSELAKLYTAQSNQSTELRQI